MDKDELKEIGGAFLLFMGMVANAIIFMTF
jgi:hypothetical protein